MISEHIDHFVQYSGIEGFKGLNVFIELKGFMGPKGIYRDLKGFKRFTGT